METLKAPSRRQILLAGAALALASRARAEAARPLKIGIMNDMSSVYADFQGVGSVVAAQLAVDDFSAKLGVPVEIISADHQNKPDVGAAIARRWFDTENVDVIMDLPNSAVALAVLAVAKEKNKAVIGSGAGSSVLTGPKCSRNFVHWTYDTYAWGHGLGKALTEAGGKSWFFITADYAFGKDIEANCAAAVQTAGRLRRRFGPPSAEYRRFLVVPPTGAELRRRRRRLRQRRRRHQHLLQAGARIRPWRKAASRRPDAQRHQYPLARSRRGRPGDDLHRLLLGRERRDPGVRQAIPGGASEEDDAERHACRHVCRDGAPLKAMALTKSAADGVKLVDEMKAIPTDDALFGKGIIRVDGRKLHPMYLYRAKTPAKFEIRLGLFRARVDDQAGGCVPRPRQGRVPVRQGLIFRSPVTGEGRG